MEEKEEGINDETKVYSYFSFFYCKVMFCYYLLCYAVQKEMSIIRQAKKATDYQSHLDDHHHSHHHHHQAHSSSSNFLPSLESLSVANSSPPCSKLGQVTHLTVDVGPQDQDEEGEKVEGDQEKEVSGRSHIFGLESENDEVRHPNEV